MRWMMVAVMLAVVGCSETKSGGGEGLRGQQGLQGEAGPIGPAGPRGEKGEPGESGGGSGDGSSSGSRLQYLGKTLRGADGSVFVQGGLFWDEELGLECIPQADRDGRTRCLPTGLGLAFLSVSKFSDANCLQAALVLDAPDGCPSPAVPRVANVLTVNECGSAWGTYLPVGEEILEAFENRNGSCVSVDMAGKNAFRLGAEIPMSAFVSFDP